MNSIGRYQLVDTVGQGGMGVVYQAFDTLLQRVVAVKVISGTIEAGPEQRERFFREARAAGQLSHRNIITIHDLGEYDGQPYLAMEYLEGEDLQRRLAGPNRMSLARKVELAIEICEGLEYAHARGVVHRDIKPANIFITESGTAKILDFGLARMTTSELTNSNKVLGTINYMSPEQVRGERADRRSDIFSVGVVLYELLGGRKAFEADSFAATLFKILQEEPEPLTKIDPTLPDDLVAIVNRALAKPRDERYQQMADMLRDLALYRQQSTVHDSPSGGRPASGGHGRALDQAHSRPQSDPPPTWDTPTIAQEAPPPGTAPAGTAEVQRVPGRSAAWFNRRIWVAGAAAALAVAAFAIWAVRPQQQTNPPASATRARAPVDHAAVTAALTRATQAFEAGDFAEARRQADAALSLDPDHSGARRVREQAAARAESVNRWLREARAHYEAGRLDEAARAAGNVLSLVPGQPDARQLLQEAAARMLRRGADDARTRMAQAKATARAAGAASLAAPTYEAAIAAERAAQRLSEAGQSADATAKFYEASGLFRSAALSAQSEAAFRAEAAKVEKDRAAAERAAPQATEARPSSNEPIQPPRPAPVQPEPTPPVARSPDSPSPGTTPRSVAPPRTAPAPPLPPTEPPAERLIAELLAHYETALETRNLDALKRLWPGLGGSQESAIRNEFQHASRIDVEIASPRIDVGDAAATATFVRRYDLATVDGQRLSSRSLTIMTLRRTGAGWVIDRVRFDPMK
jgi:serine/threonine-protein kinase